MKVFAEKPRIAYWDNLKAFLIFCVVLGHFLMPVSPMKGLLKTTHYWVYSFHMPAFVFVSGYFSRSYVKKNSKEQKLIGYLSLYILFTLGTWALNAAFGESFRIDEIMYTPRSQWFLLAMFFWHLMIPFASGIKKQIAIFLFIIIGLLAGWYESCGDFLALSRTIVLFPFFLAGFHFGEKFPRKTGIWTRVIAVVYLIGCACLISFFKDRYGSYYSLIYADGAYSTLGCSKTLGTICRFIWYVVAMTMSAGIMCLIPTRRNAFTYIGERSLAVYIVHRFVRDALKFSGFFESMNSELLQLTVCVLISAVVVLLASAAPITKALNRFFHLDFLVYSDGKNE